MSAVFFIYIPPRNKEMNEEQKLFSVTLVHLAADNCAFM